MSERQWLNLATAADTEQAGQRLAAALASASFQRFDLHLGGELGAGKTTFARGLLTGLGHTGRVPSPTYTLVEPYALDQLTVYHVDLYRLRGEAELEYLGLDELSRGPNLLVVEWPERVAAALPDPDVRATLEYAEPGRKLIYAALSPVGEQVLQALR